MVVLILFAMGNQLETPVDESATDTRRGVLAKLGVTATAVAALPTASAGQMSRDALGNGAAVDCYFSPHDKFDSLYNDMNSWENSTVWLSHDKWAENVKLRVGSVYRVSNDTVKSRYDSGPVGDDLLMCAGDWTYDDQNVWVGKKGRINTDRCPSVDSAVKYWYHELGHAHGLDHRDQWGGQLMDPHDTEAMHLNSSECQEWKSAY